MTKHIVTALYLIVGLINFAPLMGVLGQARLEALYGIQISSADMLLLLQHRAVLFGIIGGFVLVAAFKTAYRRTASTMAFISMVSFVVLAHIAGPIGVALNKVYWVDIASIIMLAFAVIFERINSTDNPHL